MAKDDEQPSEPSVPAPRAEVDQLRTFVAIARTGSVGRAAAALDRTQPTVSARLAGLERAWSTRLFRRLARGMALTPEGERLLPPAEAALRSLEELDRAAGLPIADRLELRLGAGDALGRELLPRALARLLAEQPGAELHLREGPGPALLEALQRGEIDLAFVVASADSRAIEGIELEPLVTSEVVVLRPARSGRRAPAPPSDLAALARARLVSLQAGSGFRRHVERAFASAGLTFRPAVEVGNLSLVRRFVAAGLGLAPVPAIAFAGRDSTRGVGKLRLAGLPPVVYHSATRAAAPRPVLARRLLSLLRPTPGGRTDRLRAAGSEH